MVAAQVMTECLVQADAGREFRNNNQDLVKGCDGLLNATIYRAGPARLKHSEPQQRTASS
jgi:hypothetical protein